MLQIPFYDRRRHRIVDHCRDRAQRGEPKILEERLEPLRDIDAHRLAGPYPVRPVPSGVPIAYRCQVVQAVAMQCDLAALVDAAAVEERGVTILVVPQG